MHQNQMAIADAEMYREVIREQEEAKHKSQITLLNNQVQSLKQIIEIMEKETARSNENAVMFN